MLLALIIPCRQRSFHKGGRARVGRISEFIYLSSRGNGLHNVSKAINEHHTNALSLSPTTEEERTYFLRFNTFSPYGYIDSALGPKFLSQG